MAISRVSNQGPATETPYCGGLLAGGAAVGGAFGAGDAAGAALEPAPASFCSRSRSIYARLLVCCASAE
jgi:hypothetical protein